MVALSVAFRYALEGGVGFGGDVVRHGLSYARAALYTRYVQLPRGPLHAPPGAHAGHVVSHPRDDLVGQVAYLFRQVTGVDTSLHIGAKVAQSAPRVAELAKLHQSRIEGRGLCQGLRDDLGFRLHQVVGGASDHAAFKPAVFRKRLVCLLKDAVL